MKRILLILSSDEIIFNLNWFEYLILKRIMCKKMKVQKLKFKGKSFNCVIIDEFSSLKN